ncbi:MAG: S-layer homology domain-containing protein [Peptococcaceae bacterium]|nr:S-layer homology domain-containing protein [Peptococcaceae bacterium]
MLWAINRGIIGGRPEGIFDPRSAATRAETAAMLRRLDRAAATAAAR